MYQVCHVLEPFKCGVYFSEDKIGGVLQVFIYECKGVGQVNGAGEMEGCFEVLYCPSIPREWDFSWNTCEGGRSMEFIHLVYFSFRMEAK